MASFLDKFQIKTAAPAKQKFDLSCQHITTADFMQLSPVYIKEMVPNEKISINQQSFSRTARLSVPTFGRCNMHNKAFFVPFRTIFRGWNDFITDTVHVAGNDTAALQAQVPKIASDTIITGIFKTDSGSIVGTGRYGNIELTTYTATTVYDIKYVENDGKVYGINLNDKGRQLVKILQSLGYAFVPKHSQETDNIWFSALPLLAFAKVYCDWYYPSQYYDSAERVNMEKIFNRDYSTDVVIGSADVDVLFGAILRVNYDSDYFVSAFESPVGPSNGASSSVEIRDITVDSGDNPLSVQTYGSGNYSLYDSTPGANITIRNGNNINSVKDAATITQYALDSLKALTDYMKRHQLVGARALDRYMARFGINLKSDKLNRSIYIGSQSIPLQIGDVMSQSSTDGAGLGDYAGKALAFGASNFDYETDEFGYIIIMNSIVPTVGYYQGVDRNVMHMSRLDFYTPEFDQLGNQAISSAELYVNQMDGTATSNSVQDTVYDHVFGFTPRYAEYKIGRDRMSGDFRLPTKNVAGDTSNSWHLMREFDESSFQGVDSITVSSDFVKGEDAAQYNRIFGNTNASADHFYVVHNFDIASWAPMKRLYDTYEFDSDGKDVIMDVNGVKVN